MVKTTTPTSAAKRVLPPRPAVVVTVVASQAGAEEIAEAARRAVEILLQRPQPADAPRATAAAIEPVFAQVDRPLRHRRETERTAELWALADATGSA